MQLFHFFYTCKKTKSKPNEICNNKIEQTTDTQKSKLIAKALRKKPDQKKSQNHRSRKQINRC